MKDLKKMRVEAKMTQFDLAKAIGVSVNTIIKWENEVSKPSDENLNKLKDVFCIEDTTDELC
ncbi:MAG: helix-turn-helix transcriptional regulator [Candidatus Riflebacteria bacterium]|nr:helix-turn-helix transcriptional regulator [Candidatus Riflebacteria bacterium]